MSILICELQGVRGRSMDVYDNKCVITTDVTLGSVLTHNALDGRKTVFFADVVGVQYKRSGVTIGYLQLEIPSSQMNNKSSNMFSENTYTFDANAVGNPSNDIMDMIHDFIVDRLEGYKYGGAENILENPPMELITLLSDANIKLGDEMNRFVEQEKYAQYQKERQRLDDIKRKERQRLDDIKRAEEERKYEESCRLQKLQEEFQNSGGDTSLMSFFEEAQKRSSISEVQQIWKSLDLVQTETVRKINSYIEERYRIWYKIESDPRTFSRFMEGLKHRIEN